ncbi:hypothetical protein SEA_ATUIN_204 [Arthrobacter phage Atuin]|nr:hypothetical protein SEA_ATUIN_3 [Arthrobacter phage Atuin]
MTNNNDLRDSLSQSLQESKVGYDNALTEDEGRNLADELLTEFLVMEKSSLPETKVLDNIVYVADHAIPTTRSVETVMGQALAYLAAASKLAVVQAELKAEQDKEMNVLLDIINEPLGTAQKVKTWEELSPAEIFAAREIKKLRLDLVAAKSVKVIHGGFAGIG